MKRELISHIGIAVTDLEAAIARYTLLLSDSNPEIHDVPDQKVRVAIFGAAGGIDIAGGRIELVAPTSQDSPIARFLQKNGEGLHHVCIYVEDIEAKLRELKEAGARLIDQTPRVGAEGNLIAFVRPADFGGVLIELEQRVRP